MKNNRNFYAMTLILFAILSLAFISTTKAQSTDMDNPTVLTSNVVEGEGDGKAETVYYTFTATKGNVKVTVDAKTDYYSTPLSVTLLDEDGNELLPIYVVAKGTGQREVKTKRFVRDTKVILKIRMDEDKDINLLTYKIKLDGVVKVETPPTVSEQSNTDPQTTNSSSETTSADLSTTTNTGQAQSKSSLKEKAKVKAKKEAKKIADSILD